MSVVINVEMLLPRIETERLLLFDGFPELFEAFQHGLDDTRASSSTTGKERDQCPS